MTWFLCHMILGHYWQYYSDQDMSRCFRCGECKPGNLIEVDHV